MVVARREGREAMPFWTLALTAGTAAVKKNNRPSLVIE